MIHSCWSREKDTSDERHGQCHDGTIQVGAQALAFDDRSMDVRDFLVSHAVGFLRVYTRAGDFELPPWVVVPTR